MPSPIERTRNNVRTGIFVTVAIGLAVGTAIVLSDVGESLLRPTSTYTVSFEVADGFKNLKPGAQVRVGGMVMGRVEMVRPLVVGDAAFEKIEVDFAVDRQVELFADARIFIASPLIGSDAWLDVQSVGSPASGRATDVIPGRSTPGGLASILGPDMADDATAMMDNLRTSSEDVKALTGRIRNDDWPRWAHSIDKVMAWATTATDSFDRVLAEGEGILKDNREPIHATVENLRDVSAVVKNETIVKVNALLDRGQQGVDAASTVLTQLRDDYPKWSEDIGEALAGARLTGQQLKLASIEVRRSPWKLLYTPSRGEVEHEMLYEAARSFALAGSDLKASSASAKRMLDQNGTELDEATVRQINEFLQDSFERYNAAQQRLVDVLLKQ